MSDQTGIETSLSAYASPYKPSRTMRLLLRLAPAIRIGTLTIVLPDGSQHRFEGSEPGPQGILQVLNDRVASRMLTGGKLGFCESYLDKDWTSPDVPALFEVALRNDAPLSRAMEGKAWMRALQFLAHALRPNSRTGSRKNIAQHYDLGNDFYSAWLDGTMTYSAAVFADLDAPESLEAAQRRKYQRIAERLGLTADHHVLEIGCGWGGFTEYAAAEIGARVTALTISPAQHAFATERMQRLGLGDRVDIRLQDYRDVRGEFDRIASIEMFEAVGERYWPAFFETMRERLVAGGRACLQIITIHEDEFENYRRGADYIQRFIFPGGMLPSPSRLRREVEQAGLNWGGSDSYGLHYARTLDMWQERFQAKWATLAPMGFDGRFKRMWEQYLWYCATGFRVGTIDVVHADITR